MNYVSCFYTQGDEARAWLRLFRRNGAVALINALEDADMAEPDPNENASTRLQELTNHLSHEVIGDFVISYSYTLGYIGVSMPCPMGEQIDIKA